MPIDEVPARHLMPVIVGAPRSGTTLLRFMLDSHPQLTIPPETGFLSAARGVPEDQDAGRETVFRLVTGFPHDDPTWQDFGLAHEEFRAELQSIDPFDASEGFRAFYRLYARSQGKPRYGDKTPMYAEHIETIRALLPEARFIHIIRDGRDSSLSVRKTWFAPGDGDMTTLANFWKRFVSSARAAAGSRGDYMEVRYEALVTDPEPGLRGICDFIELSFDPAMLRYFERTPQRLKQHGARYKTSGELAVTHERRLQNQKLTMEPPRTERIFPWRAEMNAEEKAEFYRAAGDLLKDLGYEQ